MKPLAFVIFLLLLFSVSVYAQEESDCSAEAIQSQVSALYEAYANSTSEDPLADLAAFQVELDAIQSACASSSVEATAEAPDGTLSATDLIEGKWEVQWSRTGSESCQGQGGTSASNRNFILTVDVEADSFTADDILVWPPLIFTASVDGGYQFLRNIALNDGTVISYDYRVTLLSERQIEGTSTFFDPAINCALENHFTMILVDEAIICLVASETGGNLRAGAGTDFQRNGTLPSGERTDVVGQTVGSDGFTWWQLDSEAWVRSDLVEEAGRCENLPVIDS